MFHVKSDYSTLSEGFRTLLRKHLDISLSSTLQDKFELYLQELRSWNKRINLISRKKDKPEDIYRHFLDSLLIFKVIKIPKNSRILDIGSGAGFPAIPIKLVRDDLNIVMVESVRKKVLFLKKMIEVLELKDVAILQERIEELQSDSGLRESFDFVTAKAFGKLKQTIFDSYPFLKHSGTLIAYKGSSYKTEIIELLEEHENLRIQIADIKFFEIPEIDLKRFFVLIEKTS